MRKQQCNLTLNDDKQILKKGYFPKAFDSRERVENFHLREESWTKARFMGKDERTMEMGIIVVVAFLCVRI